MVLVGTDRGSGFENKEMELLQWMVLLGTLVGAWYFDSFLPGTYGPVAYKPMKKARCTDRYRRKALDKGAMIELHGEGGLPA